MSEAQEQDEMMYQVRIGGHRSPEDVVTELTQAVWRCLAKSDGIVAPDPRGRPDLYSDVRDAFKERLAYHPRCGTNVECACVQSPYGDVAEIPHGVPYILRLKGGLLEFVDLLAQIARTKLSRSWPDGRAPRGFNERLSAALHRALSPYLFYTEACSRCGVLAEADAWHGGAP